MYSSRIRTVHNSFCVRFLSQVPKLYGHYVSQPSRSILWLLKIKNQPFEFVTMDPVKGETRAAPYTSKFPTALIPGLEDNGFYLAEGIIRMHRQSLCIISRTLM